MLNRSYIINFSAFLIYLMPLSLLSGPLIPEIILFFTSTIFIIYSIKEKLWFYYTNYFSYFFIIFYFYITLRSLLSIDPVLSLESSLFYFRFGLFALTIWFLIDNKKNFIKNFSIFLFFTFILAITDGIYQIYHNYNLFGFISPETRMSLTLNDNLYLGGFLSRLFPLLFATLMYSYSSRLFISLLFILFIVTDVTIFVAGERTAIGLMVISTVYILLMINRYKKIRLMSFIISLIIISLIILYSPDIKQRNITQTYNQLTSTVSNIENGKNIQSLVILSPGHNQLFLTALNMFKDKPIFGHGPKLFRKLCGNEKYAHNDFSCSTHPHNIYFQTLAEIGIFGLFFFIVIISYFGTINVRHMISKTLYSKALISDYQICISACFLITLWPFFPTQNLFNNWINIVFYLPIGFYLQSLNRKKNV